MQRDIDDKIKTVDELKCIVESLKANGKTVVQCHGVFDLVHAGHIRHFRMARRFGDVLIVTLATDAYVGKGPGRPVFNQRLRSECLAALQCVDYVATVGCRTVEAIRHLKPDVYVKGSSYIEREDDPTGDIHDEEQAILSVGGRIAFTDEIMFGSASLLNSYFPVFSKEAEVFLKDFRRRYSPEDVIGRLRKLRSPTVLVIGEAIIDQYHYCRPLGKPSKAHIVSAKFLQGESYAGGALAVANHIAGFCRDVHLVTCLGEEHTREDFIRDHLKPNVRPRFFYRPHAPTVTKRRYIAQDLLSKMFEVCFLNDTALPGEVASEVCAYLGAVSAEYDLVVVADFGHGFIGPHIIDVLCQKARYLAVNTQANSANLGFNVITKYPRADYVCIDREELRLAYRDKTSSLEHLARRTARILGCKMVTVTRGSHGSLTYEEGNGFVQIPVFSDEVVDTVGAGDAYLSLAALCAAAGEPNEVVGFVGNVAGALAVRIVGNKESVEPALLYNFVRTLLG